MTKTGISKAASPTTAASSASTDSPSRATEAAEPQLVSLPLDEAELETTIAVLEQIAADRGRLLSVSQDLQTRLLRVAGQVAHPGRAAKRQLVRASREQRREEQLQQKQRDEQRLEQTGIRQLQKHSVRRLGQASPVPNPQAVLPPPRPADHAEHFSQPLEVARNCYICKRDFRRLHFFYDSMCPDCASFNWSKRQQSADLSGRYAVLTGGRVKIGFEAALKLLRAGAHLIVTTRFPRDAALRFAAQSDSDVWLARLQVFGLDLRHTPSVEAFASHLLESLPRLDFILNNACQTVRRPPAYYEHLMSAERQPVDDLPAPVRQVLQAYHELVDRDVANEPAAAKSPLLPDVATLPTVGGLLTGLDRAAELSQLALLPEERPSRDSQAARQHFPAGHYDRELQQIDLRDKNSWRLKLAEIDTVEMLEVQLVNAVAPFLLNARLKPLMLRTTNRDKHIVNVSAMEGVFYRAFKRDTHPHTNMAKAALNMMTRTSAVDYVRDGIHMNSVDTGWITDEDPIEITHRKQAERGFSTPLDTIDAAARICDPIFAGLNSGEHQWGKFLKDYQISNW